ncbi:MAG: PDDEXK nuclease domain-containing protein [Thermoguttaceae bacterium]|nr:PDDEXK nuclease domain-containing protein [Thermoguttaceae bacterium]
MLLPQEYNSWLNDLKGRIRQTQLKAAVRVNTEMLAFYWNLGREIDTKQRNVGWDDSIIRQLSKDLMEEFPNMTGFSYRNLNYMRNWYRFYSQKVEIPSKKENRTGLQQTVAIPNDNQLLVSLYAIPWGHNIEIVSKCKTLEEALFYVRETLENGWSRSVLVNMISTDLFHAQGNAITNFSRTLPEEFSDLAQQTLRDPYCFDFLTMRKDYSERELEDALVAQVTNFLLALGCGFAYIGRQVPLQVGEEEFFLDLLFYHLKLRCFVVIELKAGKFHPRDLGQLGFYVTAVNNQMKHPTDSETIGLLICQDKDKIVAEYALQNASQPLGISRYELGKILPENFQSSLPSIEEIEQNLSKNLTNH